MRIQVIDLAPGQYFTGTDPDLIELETYMRECDPLKMNPQLAVDRGAPQSGAVAPSTFLANLSSGVAPAEPPEGRVVTAFTPVAAAAGLSVNLQYLAVGDRVLWRGARMFVAGFVEGIWEEHKSLLVESVPHRKHGEYCRAHGKESFKRVVYALQECTDDAALSDHERMPPPLPRALM